jgi:tetratricopeptide (TPR) repeat protein
LGAAWLAYLTGDHESGRRLGEATLEAARAIDDSPIAVVALNVLGAQASSLEDYERARRRFEQAAALARRCGDDHGLAAAIGNLGTIAYALGEWNEAVALYTEQLSSRAEWPQRAPSLVNIALAELRAGHDPVSVAGRYEEVFRRATESGDALYAAWALWGLGLTAASAGRSCAAVHALAAWSMRQETLGYALEASDRALYEVTLEELRVQLGEETFAAAWAEGRLLTLEDAALLALESMRSASPTPGTSACL